jgi:hypothetical protein
MPATALQHFREDIARARAIIAHAAPLPHATHTEQLLRSDLLRSAWMFAVGALDAYFCECLYRHYRGHREFQESTTLHYAPRVGLRHQVSVAGRH